MIICTCDMLVKNVDSDNLEKTFNFTTYLHYFHYCFLWERLAFPSPNDTLCQVWLKFGSKAPGRDF